jgi:hypothetical protein
MCAGLKQRSEARYIGKILAEQLIRQAAVAHLILRVFGIVGAHAAAQSVERCPRRRGR